MNIQLRSTCENKSAAQQKHRKRRRKTVKLCYEVRNANDSNRF